MGNANAETKGTVAGKGSKKPVIIGAAAVVVLIICGVAAYASGIFLSPADRILLGMQNSFRGDGLTEAMGKIGDIAEDGTFTLDGNIDIQSEDLGNSGVSVTWCQDRESGEQSAGGTLTALGQNYTFGESLDDETLQVTVPGLLGDNVLSYPYTVEKSGYLTTLMDQEQMDTADAYLQLIHSTVALDTEAGNVAAAKALRSDFESLDFEKSQYTQGVMIDGADVECTVYTTTMSAEFINSTVDDLSDAYGESLTDYVEAMEKIAELTGNDSYTGMLDSFRVDAENSQGYDAQFLLNGKELAGMTLTPLDADGKEVSDDAIVLKLTGSDIPWHVTELSAGDAVINIAAVVDGDSETVAIYAGDGDPISFTYDTKEGGFALGTIETSADADETSAADAEVSGAEAEDSESEDDSGAMITGSLTFGDGSCTLATSSGDGNLSVKLTLSRGAEISKPTAGATVDLGNMTSEQYDELSNTMVGNLAMLIGL